MAYTSEALAVLGETGGPCCCKRDAMLAFEVAVKYINAHYDVSLHVGVRHRSGTEDAKRVEEALEELRR